MPDFDDWLDTQTKAHLEESPPDKLAPPLAAGYSVVLLRLGYDIPRVVHTLKSLVGDRVNSVPDCPCVILRQLSLTDALQAQFELICANAISVFIDDEVLRNAKPSYLNDVLKSLRSSSEFESVRVHVRSLPDGLEGSRFLNQFFGRETPLPVAHVVPRKKARIMQHWGHKLGAVIECEGETT